MTGSSETRIFRVELPPGLPTLNANDRVHYMARSKKTEKLRAEAYKAAKAQPFIPFSKVKLRCIFRAPDNRRRDVANLYPSFKAIVDGLVDAGVMKDDHDGIVREFTIVRGENYPKKGQLIVEVSEVDDGRLRAGHLRLACFRFGSAVRGELELPRSRAPERRP